MKLLLLLPFSFNDLLLFKIFKISLVILLLSFPISSDLFGQVVIKERIEVDPSIPVHSKIINNTTQSHTISASVPWEAVDHIRVKLQIKNHCTGQIVDSGYELGGFAQVSMTATHGGSYSVTTIFEGWNTWGRNWCAIYI